MIRSARNLSRALLICVALPYAVIAHPMGNFSVNHYSRLHFEATGLRLTYVLDLAEIPAFQLLSQWTIDGKDSAVLAAKTKPQAREWLTHLSLTQNGHRIPLHLKTVTPAAIEGAGGMSILRVEMIADATLQPGEVTFEDTNYPGRAGWKEIVIDHDRAATLRSSSQTSTDLSHALTVYPADPTVAPPQALTATVNWSPVITTPKPVVITKAPPLEERAPQPATFSQQQLNSPGAVVKGDYLSRMLQRKQLTSGIILLGLLVAFGLGTLHALSPGHGKTIVAAYLVGSRGTLKHASLLGLVVTFTHTFTVFLLGIGVLFFQQYIVPEKIIPILGSLSGLSIVCVGVLLLYRRATALMQGNAVAHAHDDFAYAAPAPTRISQLRGTSETSTIATIAPPPDITHGSLIALGISGGLVPCPSALILMLSAIALGHAGLGLLLLIAFSTGLALVLMVFGVVAVYARHLLPNSDAALQKPVFRLLPVFSSVIVICLGLAMTAVSAGWVPALRFLS